MTDGSPIGFSVEETLLPTEATVREALDRIDATDARIALVVDRERHLVGTVTDGDIRRGLLAGKTLETAVQDVMNSRPTTADAADSADVASERMRSQVIRQLPILDADGRVVGLHLLERTARRPDAGEPVLLMAGGFGRRLGRLTKRVPKPLVNVGGRPILETLVRDLTSQGFARITLAVSYRASQIEDFFGDGSKFGAAIDYIHEPIPLGTAGAIRLFIERSRVRFIVANADLLTRVDFRALVDFHVAERNELTIALIEWAAHLRYGLVETSGTRVINLREKPTLWHFVNAGIYVLEPNIADFVPRSGPFDMNELVATCLQDHRTVGGFPIYEYWVDVGRPEDLRRAARSISDRSIRQ